MVQTLDTVMLASMAAPHLLVHEVLGVVWLMRFEAVAGVMQLFS
jgi:hypothetical protein